MLRPYQIALESDIYAAWGQHRNVLAVAPTGSGKCLGRGTPILMFDGTIKPVETVTVGDKLMGPDSRPRKILSVCRGTEELFRITPVKGDSYVVNASHILSLKKTTQHSGRNEGGGLIVNIPVTKFVSSSKWFRHIHKGWRAGVEWCPAPRPALDPYFFGVWLGDGASRHPSICTGDAEIKNWLKAYADSLGMDIRVEPNSVGSEILHLITRHAINLRLGHTINPIKNALRDCGALYNKHIPLEYKTASRSSRLSLLAGIIDTDGHYSRGGYYLTLASEKLLDDTIFLARSLGFAAYKSEVQKKCHNNGKVGTYWSTCVHGDIEEVPCLIARKKAPKRQQKKSVLVTGLQVESIGEGDYFGFEIDGDHLFLLGDFTVTHNTVLYSKLLMDNTGAAVAIAHRSELVSQTSMALARNGVRHRIIGTPALARTCTSLHLAELNRNYVDPHARVAAAGVDTLIRRNAAEPWFKEVTLWVCDEAHHPVKGNKWDDAIDMFPNARGLGVTATPCRADGKGLGRHADGVFDHMIVGPTMRDLIKQGYLTDYRIFAPPSDIDMSQVTVSASGDYSPPKLASAVHHSHIVGDVVQHYLRIAAGKLGVTFAVDVESATEIAQAYRQAGVPAEVVSAKTPADLRAHIMRRFRLGEIRQLVNVDLLGEGTDVPAIEVVSMARPTQSYGLFVQQFGRALRPMEGKTHAIIIDHVANTLRHGLPDAPRTWSLDRRERRTRSTPDDVIPIRVCTKCLSAYERIYVACPYCGERPVPSTRSSPAEVDGDLSELSPEVLARLRGEVAATEAAPAIPYGATPEIAGSIKKHYWARRDAQTALRTTMALWGGWREAEGDSIAEQQRRFFLTFGVDVLSAQTLGRAEAEALRERVGAALDKAGIVGIDANGNNG